MFQHTEKSHHHHLHLGEGIKKAARWYFIHSAELYVWSPKPLDPTQK